MWNFYLWIHIQFFKRSLLWGETTHLPDFPDPRAFHLWTTFCGVMLWIRFMLPRLRDLKI